MCMDRLKEYVSDNWQPSWYDLAGVLLPTRLLHSSRSKPSKTSGTARDSKASRSVAQTKVATKTRQSNRTACSHPSPDVPGEAGTKRQQSPSEQREPDSNARTASIPRPSKKARSSSHPPTSTLIVKDADGVQPTEELQSKRLEGSSTAVDLVDTPRPRREAKNKAVDLIRKCQAPRKRGSGISRRIPAAQRKVKMVNGIQKPDGDGKDITEIKDPSIPNKVISPITGILPHSSNDPRLH